MNSPACAFFSPHALPLVKKVNSSACHVADACAPCGGCLLPVVCVCAQGACGVCLFLPGVPEALARGGCASTYTLLCVSFERAQKNATRGHRWRSSIGQMCIFVLFVRPLLADICAPRVDIGGLHPRGSGGVSAWRVGKALDRRRGACAQDFFVCRPRGKYCSCEPLPHVFLSRTLCAPRGHRRSLRPSAFSPNVNK